MPEIKQLQQSEGVPVGSPTSFEGTATAKSADYTVLDTDNIRTVLMTTGASNRTVTLPTAVDNASRMITIYKVDSGAGVVIIDGEGSETINGDLTQRLSGRFDSMTVQCDGSAWHILNDDKLGDDAVLAYQSTADQALSLTEPQTVVVTFDTESIDSNGAFASNVFTARKAGRYRVSFAGSVIKSSGTAAATKRLQASIQKNSADVLARPVGVEAGTTGRNDTFSTTVLSDLAVGDTIRAVMSTNFGGGETWVGTLQSAHLAINRV